jgi:D-alanyl-D-alanine carboxypeptidase/D-alanyl-D-alanine-endopeptidase (penicillin-binding protein 4)
LSSRNVQQKTLPRTGAQYLCTASHDIDDVLIPMIKDSDNIYAECVFYQIAAIGDQKQAGRKQAAAHIQNLLDQLGQQEVPCTIADGCGLSLYNYLTPQLLICLLNFAYQTPAIREHFLTALPIAGMDGTLEKRMKGTAAEGNVRAKTGTLSGISSLAGYLRTANGHELSFSIINQGVARSSQGRDFQDQVCQTLCTIQ